MDVEAKTREIIVKLLGIKPDELAPSSKLEDDLGVDSTELVEIIIALEKNFGIHIKEGHINKFSSFENLVNYIKESTAKKS